ncbi:BT1926 family outer membrane beta-barrel protein [Pedobacter nyackensis]|uniref:Outer membrane protein beta-barrel domain-containing protein n=1 Tax=Pedobacter nyackensis TaxID=475255 RepID=A0A1W2C2Y0_9SPHI|nr:BT1926 family outer membrane beta-barrel protein [Pedobacter nyackensis]SMC79597.1 Outer membrane protein beta-barrel domain-containing protein [Pedobacter nyackensis]
MKKLLLSLSVAMLGLAAQAQDFKPAKGDVTTEFGLTGGINDTNFELNDGAGLLRFRYFHKENLAFRLGFNVGSSTDKGNAYGLIGTPNADKTGSAKRTETQFLINLGVEKHFAGTDRLSPYVGADFLIGGSSTKTTYENATGAVAAPVYADGVSSETKGPGSTIFGLRGVVGADYYIAKRLYLGAEAGFGFAYEKDGETTVTNTAAGTTTTVTHKSAGNSFDLSPSVITGVRIGFVF